MEAAAVDVSKEGSDTMDIESFVEWSSDDTDNEEDGCVKQTSNCVSHEELSALKGCVTRRRALFSPKSFNEVPSFKFQELPYCASESQGLSKASRKEAPHKQLHSDRLQEFELNPCASTVSDSVPDSVSVQFGDAGYECETVCESNSRPAQQRQRGLNITAISKSDCNIDVQKPGQKTYDFSHRSLSCSIPGELNSSSLRFPQNLNTPGKVYSFEQGLSQSENGRFSNKTLCNSWPRQQIFQCCNRKVMRCQCSPKHASHIMHSANCNQSPPSIQTGNSLAHQGPYTPPATTIRGRDMLIKPYFPSSCELGSTFSISSHHSLSNPSSARPHISYSTGVDGQVFKDRTEVS